MYLFQVATTTIFLSENVYYKQPDSVGQLSRILATVL